MTRQLGRFELGEQIDAGGFTTVYRATEDLGQGITRPAAVKILKSWNLGEEGQLERLRREVEVLVELGGAPNIVSVLATGIDEEMGAWIAMELAGKSLVHFIGEDPAEPDEVRILLRDTLRALSCIHGAEPQILHRDLKPQNILSSQGSWKVGDFGVAKRRGADETMSLATVKYAAPELLDATLGEESPRLDLYALGMMAYEFALGRELFRKQFPSIYDPAGDAREGDRDERPKWMYWHTSQKMTLPPIADLVDGYPQDLSDLIEAMTAKPLGQRLGSAEEALRRLGAVGAPALRRERQEGDEVPRTRRVSPALALGAILVVLVAVVAGSMWYLLEGRPRIELASDGVFRGTGDTVQVTGVVENIPEAGRAEIQLRRGSVRSFAVAFEPDGRFTCDVRVRELGTFPATMVVKDRSGASVARTSLELERVEPTTVRLELKTSPAVEVATILVRPSGKEDSPITLTTDASGAAQVEVPYGEFSLEVFHPRYLPLPKVELQTGIDPVWTRTVNLVERDYAALRAEMQREINRLMRLMERKTTCPPGPLTPAEEEQVRASSDRLRQLADGDTDIELFLEAVGRVEDCDPTTMVTAPELPPPPVSAEEALAGGPDPAVRINRVIARIERLIDRKVDCPPGPLSDFEEQALSDALEELRTLALGDIDIELYIDAVARVEDCDPTSRPAEVPAVPTRAEREPRERGGATAAGVVGAGAGGDAVDRVVGEVGSFLAQHGLGTDTVAGIRRGGAGVETAEAIIARVLAQVPPNPELVSKLFAMPLDEFAEFVRRNVPTGTVEVVALDDLDLVRVSGPVFRAEELELLTIRLAYGIARIQPELSVDPWGVCRGLARALTAAAAEGVRVDAYLEPSDPTLFVQFEKKGGFEPGHAEELARTFVVDPTLLWVRGYSERPEVRPEKAADGTR